MNCLWSVSPGISCALHQLLGPKPMDVAVEPYLRQVLKAPANMGFGLISRIQWYSHDFTVFSECFNPLDVMLLFHRVRNRGSLDRCPVLCFFNNRLVLLVFSTSRFCGHLCHCLPATHKSARSVMEHLNEVATDFALVKLILLCHSVTSLSSDE